MAGYVSLRDEDGEMHDNRAPASSDDWRLRLTEIGKKMGESVSAVGGKITEQVSVVGDRMKEMFHNPTLGERLVEEATNDLLIGPDWGKNLQICDLVNAGQVPGAEVARTIKLRLAMHGKDHVQLLALSLLEMAVKNSVQLFADVANEKLLDEMVRVVDDRSSHPQVTAKCLMLIEAWGEATEELRYLPVYEETYKSLKSRGISFPPRDSESLAPIFTPPSRAPANRLPPAAATAVANVEAAEEHFDDEAPSVGVSTVTTADGGRVVVLDSKEIFAVARNSIELLQTVLTSAPPEEVVKDELALTLAAQCRAAKRSIQRLVEVDGGAAPGSGVAGSNAGQSETILFEALSINDDLDKVLDKLTELQQQQQGGQGGAAGAAAEPTGAAATVVPPPAPAAVPVPVPVADLLGSTEEEESSGGPALVRNRGGGGSGAASGADAAAGGGIAKDDEAALAELDEMVFGRKEGGGSSTQQGEKKGSKPGEDDLIVF